MISSQNNVRKYRTKGHDQVKYSLFSTFQPRVKKLRIVIWQIFLRVEKTFRELATFKYLPLPVAYRAIAVRRAR